MKQKLHGLHQRSRALLLLTLFAFTPGMKGWGQVNISAGSTVLEPFSIGLTAAATLPTGWKVDKNTTVRLVGTYSAAGTATAVLGGNAMSSTAGNGIYNYGAGVAATATDRAVGGLSSSSASKSVNLYSQLFNSGATTINQLTISYNVEKYRQGSNPAGFSIQMYYSTDGTTWINAGPNFLTSFASDADNTGYTSAPGVTSAVTSQTLVQAISAASNFYLAWNYSVTGGTTTSNAQALGIDDVSITAEATASIVQSPIFTPVAGNYFAPISVSMSSPNTGATIRYTTNGFDPDETSPVFDPLFPIPVSVTTTVKAKAYFTGMTPSGVSSALYRFPISVTNIAALRLGLTDGTVYKLTGEALVTYARPDGQRNQLYIQDATAAIVVDDAPLTITTNYVIGDGVTGLTGTLTLFSSLLEFVPLLDPGTATSTGNTITPIAKTLSTITSADQAKLVSIPSVSFTSPTGNFLTGTAPIGNYAVTDASGSGLFRTLFAEADYITTPTPVPSAPQNMIALVGQSGTVIQITPRFAADMTPIAPLWTSGWPKAEDASQTVFTAKANISSPGTAYFVVLPSGAAAPTALQVKSAQDATGTSVAANLAGTIACAAGSTEYVASVGSLTSATTYDVYFVAEAYSILQTTPVLVSVTTSTAVTAPVVISPTVASITSTTALLGGNITSDGGSAITERGTVWSLTSPVTTADNKLAEGSTAIGVFTQTRTLPSTTPIFFAAYATNAVGTTLSTEGSFTTFTPEPTNHATVFTAGTATTSTIPLTWTDATGAVLPEAYLIKGSTVSFEAISDPADGTPEANAALVQNVNQGTGTFTFTGLTAETPYFFKIYAYTNSGSAIDYKTGTIPEPTPSATATTLALPVGALLYEDFNYTPADNIGGNTASAATSNNNWTTHSNSQVGIIEVLAGNLSFNGLLAATGNKVKMPGSSATTRDVNRAIGTNTNTIMYLSALINVVDSTQLGSAFSDNGYFLHLGSAAGISAGSFYSRVHIKKVTGNKFRLGIQNVSGGTPTQTEYATDLAYGTPCMIVVKYDQNGASPDIATLWVNPTSLGGLEPTGGVTNNSGTTSISVFASVCLRNASATPKAEIDEIRVGNTWADVTPAGATAKTLNLKAYFQGFWNGTGLNQAQDVDIDFNIWNKWTGTTVDTLSVYLADANAPFGYVFEAHAVNLLADGSMSVSVPASLSGSYYVAIVHRSSVETWSAAPISFIGSTIVYDFTTAANQAFASNQVDLLGDGSVWGFWGGEVYGAGGTLPADGYIDINDVNAIYNQNVNGVSGYMLEDITGDGFVDINDFNMVYNNNVNGVGLNTPVFPMKRPRRN